MDSGWLIIVVIMAIGVIGVIIEKNEEKKTAEKEIEKRKYSTLKEWGAIYKELEGYIGDEFQNEIITNAAFARIKEKKEIMDKQSLMMKTA